MSRQESTSVSPFEIERQNEIMAKIRQKNDKELMETGKQKYYFNLAMGCQMNAHDSEKLSGMMEQMGYVETQDEIQADFVIYNTCCIRENAESKVYGKLGWLKHYKEKNPNLRIALCGCMMQQETVLETIGKKHRHVDIIFGTFNLYKLPELMEIREKSNRTVVDIWQEQKEIVENLPHIRKYPFKACVNIVYGCNNFCSYCIVPYVRGRERSREKDDILREIKELAKGGTKEIMLLGQNVNSYGKTLETPISFAELLREVNEIEGIERIRFMTSHPKDLSDALILAMKECDKVVNQLHLPVQSGSTEILRRMNRKYTKESYLEVVRKVKQAVPDMAISTDIIVGFPGETETDFEDTLDVVRQVGYASAYTFIYSKRTGTPAATMENQVPEEVVKERFERLLNTLNPLIHQVGEANVGKTYQVLVEDYNSENEGILSGRAPNNSLIHFKGSADLIGQIVPVEVVENKTFYFIGERKR